MHRPRSRRSRGFLQAFRRWAPWVAHLALAAILNTSFDGPTWADEIGRQRALDASLIDAERFPPPPSLDELVKLLTPALERALASSRPIQPDTGTIPKGASKGRLRRDPHPLAPSPTRTIGANFEPPEGAPVEGAPLIPKPPEGAAAQVSRSVVPEGTWNLLSPRWGLGNHDDPQTRGSRPGLQRPLRGLADVVCGRFP